MVKRWRPEGWEKIKEEHRVKVLKEKYKLFDDDYLEAGFDAALEVLSSAIGSVHVDIWGGTEAYYPFSLRVPCKGHIVFIPDDTEDNENADLKEWGE